MLNACTYGNNNLEYLGFGQKSTKKEGNESWVLGTCQRTLIYLGDLGKIFLQHCTV